MLWQVAQSQEAVLGAKVSDGSGGLAQLHGALYAQQAVENSQKMPRYPVSLTGSDPIQATLIDFDGDIAQAMLNQGSTALRESAARAILHADALILLVDPTVPSAQLEKEFRQFCEFVQSLETLRIHRAEVAGMPVYAVLTKCDKLAKATENGSAWVQRVEESKRRIDKRLQDVLSKIPNRATLPFGKVDVRVWATAVKRPQSADRPARAQEPYGVAELFRECFQAAREFHNTRQRSQERIKYALVGFIGLIAVMALAGGIFFISRPAAEVTSLESKIRDALPGPKGNERFKEPIDDRIKKLEEISGDKAFDRLSQEQRDEVTGALKELEEYQKQNKEFVKTVKDPKFAKDDADLMKIEKELDTFKPPEEYKEAWAGTKLVKRQEQFRQDIKNIREAVKTLDAWFRERIEEGKKLKKQGGLVIAGSATLKERETWFTQVQDFVTRPLLYKETDRLANSPSVSYGTVYRFPSVERVHNELRGIKKSLEDLRRQAQ